MDSGKRTLFVTKDLFSGILDFVNSWNYSENSHLHEL